MGSRPLLDFFWTSPVTLESLSPAPSTLDAEALGTLRGEAERLFADALAERPPDERDETLTLGDAIVHRVAGTGVVAVLFPTDMKCSECITSDGRGSIFFLYAPADRRIVFQTFGHPEWNPAGKSVRVVMPRLYFRICGDPEVYFLADYHGPWEEIRYAIFQMRSGLRMLVSWGG